MQQALSTAAVLCEKESVASVLKFYLNLNPIRLSMFPEEREGIFSLLLKLSFMSNPQTTVWGVKLEA